MLMLVPFMAISQTLPVVFEDWNSQEGTQNFFVRSVTATDASNNIYVAGATINTQGNYDILLAKYKSDGTFEWASQYAGQGAKDDAATAIALVGGTDIYVTGHVFNTPTDSTSLVLLKYDSNGNLIWDEIYNTNNALADAGTSIIIENNAVYVGGVSVDTLGNVDFLALKYDTAGSLLWNKLYDHAGYIDLCHKITARTIFGNTTVRLTGASQVAATDWRYLSVSLNGSNGNVTGSTSSTGGSAVFSKVTGVERDAAGDVYITGSVYNMMSGYDFYTVKINASNTNVVWDATYNSSGTLNDEAMALAVDSVGNVYVTGYSETSTQGTNYTTIKYDSNGSELWVKNYNASSNGADTAKAIVLHPNGSVIVSGASFNGSNTDVVTLKYDTAGTQKWEIAFNSVFNKNDTPFDMAIDTIGDIVIAGQSQNNTSYTYTTIKYKEMLVTLPVDSVSLASHYGFTPNKGQLLSTDTTLIPHIRYYTHKDYYSIYFSDTACSFVLAAIDTTMANDTLHRVDMKYKNYMAPKVRAMDITDYYSNFYYAHTAQGREKVHDYKQLYNANAWDKVDVLINFNAGGIKYNIIAHPGFKESNIEFEFNGQDSIYIDNNELIIQTSIGNIVLPEPKAYEIDANDNLSPLNWTPQYVLNGNTLSFSYGSYNTSEKLAIVIERALPAISSAANGNLEWSTYLGGNHDDCAIDIKVDPVSDAAANVFVAGFTASSNFPNVVGSINQPVFGGYYDAFISVFNNSASHTWTTYIGGTQDDRALSLHLSNNNSVYIAGITLSSNFPVYNYIANQAYYQDFLGGERDAFITKLLKVSGFMQWSTYFGGFTKDVIHKITEDGNGNLLICGSVKYNQELYPYFPIEYGDPLCAPPIYNNGFPGCEPQNSFFTQNHSGGGYDAFVAKFDSNRSLIYSSMFGGPHHDAAWDLIVDNSNNSYYVTGYTKSTTIGNNSIISPCSAPSNSGFPLCDLGGGSYFQNNNIDQGAFIMQFNSQNQLLWSTFFGLNGEQSGHHLALNSNNDLYLVGLSTTVNVNSPDVYCGLPTNNGFPLCNPGGNAYFRDNNGVNVDYDAFVTRFNQNKEIVWSTFYGGSGDESALIIEDGTINIAIDESDNIYILGNSKKTSGNGDINLKNHQGYYYQNSNNGSGQTNDAFIACFNSNNEDIWSTYFGGGGFGINAADWGHGITIDSENNKLYITGMTISSTFPLECPPSQNPYCQNTLNNLAGYYDAYVARFHLGIPTNIQKEDSIIYSNNIIIYPNPAKYKINVLSDIFFSEDFVVKLYSFTGEEVNFRMNQIAQNEIELDVSDINTGIYFIQLYNNKNNIIRSGKFIKQ